MHILIVTDYYKPGNSRLIDHYAEQLNNSGHRVELLSGLDPAESIEMDTPNFDWHQFDYPLTAGFFKKIKTIHSSIKQFKKQHLANHLPDLFIFNQPLSALPFIQYLSGNSTGLYIHHAPWADEWIVHNPPASNFLKRFFKKPLRLGQIYSRRWWERTVLKRCSKIIVLSDFMKEKLLTNHPNYNSNRICRIPGGTDPERFKPRPANKQLRKNMNLPADIPLFLTVRRLVPRMGVDRLIRAFAKFIDKSKYTNSFLVIGGKGPEKESLQELAEELIPGQYQFTGYISEEKLPDYYSSADLFVLPTRRLEGFGLVTVEALASETPVVATKVGGTPEILTDLDPELLLPAQEKKWPTIFQKVLDKYQGSKAQNKCRKYILENYTWNRVGENLDNLLKKVNN